MNLTRLALATLAALIAYFIVGGIFFTIPAMHAEFAKYPAIYRGLDVLIINKTDLLPYVPFNMAYFQQGVELMNPGLVTFPISCRTGEGVDAWTNWLIEKRTALKK